MKLNGTAKINNFGHLEIGGYDTTKLVEKYQTPLFVYDETLIRKQCQRFHNILKKSNLNYQVSYASKAFTCLHLIKIIQEENMRIDVVSMGEIYTALKAGFNPEHIHFHGNNKTEEEINFALNHHINWFVIDSFDEITRLNHLAKLKNKKINCLLRVTPGIEAHTHDYITTGNTDSKFGLNIDNNQAALGIQQILLSSHLNLKGIHFHIGSQIFETTGTLLAIEKVFNWFVQLKEQFHFIPKILNIGGGFGIRYTSDDISYPIESALESIIQQLNKMSAQFNIPLPELWLEPGRSIVGEAGYTIYTIGTIKEIPNVRTYVSIDGGMSDHIRTALYQAKYEVALANRMNDTPNTLVTIAGKCCESGDIIAYDVTIAKPTINDLAVVSCTGAYHYAMSSNYNQMLRPAVVFVKDKMDYLAIKRESLEDLIKNQMI